MTRIALSVSAAAVLALVLVVGCSLGTIVGNATVDCGVKVDGGAAQCIITKDFPSTEQSTVESECTSNGGTLVGFCPAGGLIGCCTQGQTEFTVETCYYIGTASQLQAECKGSWTTSE